MKRKSIPSKVTVENNRVLRFVDDLSVSLKILNTLLNKSSFADKIVKTSVAKDKQNCLEHELIAPILHSEEYTTSMAYDITKLGIDMAIEAEKLKVYSFDLLPHNYTFYRGKWILYDFGAFEATPENVKTQIRSTFKISFSNFELLKIVNREKLRECFLNRISIGELAKMISAKRFLPLFLWQKIAQFLILIKQYSLSYKILKVVFNKYQKELRRKVFAMPRESEKLSFLNEMFEINNIKDVLCVGEEASAQALLLNQNTNFFAYIDDYQLCDDFYNRIKSDNLENIACGVIYPLNDDEIINENISSYRAIYDSYAQKRFLSDAVLCINAQKYINASIEDFAVNLSKFADKYLILSFDNIPTKILETLNQIFYTVYTREINNTVFVIACNRKEEIKLSTPIKYGNNNRGQDAKLQSKKILNLLNKEKFS